jgi:hypothetical protein
MSSVRVSLSLCLLALILCCSVLFGPLALGPQRAFAEEGGEGTTTAEPPPVVETPTEGEKTPELPTTPSETPVTTPPHETTTGGGVTTPVETTKAPGTSGSEAASGAAGGGGGGGTGSGGGSSAGSASTGATTAATGTTATSRTGRVRHQASGGGAVRQTPSQTGGGGSTQPTVSTKEIDSGAEAVSHAASHVGEVFAAVLPTAPLQEVGTRLATHLGLIPAADGKARKQAVDRIGTALGAALIGSAVAVDRAPPPTHRGPIPFFDPPGGSSGVFLTWIILIAALLVIGAVAFREIHAALGFNPRLSASRAARSGWSDWVRQLSSSALAGLRSLF